MPLQRATGSARGLLQRLNTLNTEADSSPRSGARRSRRFGVRTNSVLELPLQTGYSRQAIRPDGRAPFRAVESHSSNLPRRTPPKNLGLMELIRAKRESSWKPFLEELRKGFRGWHQRGYLPHFDAPNVTQLVTFNLADSFPVTRRAEWEAILRERDDSVKRRQSSPVNSEPAGTSQAHWIYRRVSRVLPAAQNRIR